ncbi:MAG: hypothetical protein EP330_27220 [Deltaproteobacteria bacterium]|nr:MAG: hypothetical protein EP330_27220 [Deltaproteobacteria bacterium]
MAEIYKARLEGIGGFQRTFAIKRILPHLSANNEYVAMLVDEAKVAGLLSHANIVQILDLGQVDGMWYIAMEYVNGYDLGAVLKRAKERGIRLPVPHCCFLAIELLKGLEYAHQRQVMRGGRPVPLNIIHRDVSPPNILLSKQGEVKLTDFGIARASLKAMETQAGVIKGRFDYMSPEQASGAKDLDQRSDLFSAGVVLYEALCGVHPFRTDSELTTLERVRDGQYKPVSQINPEVPRALEVIVDKALRVDRRERFPTATAFKEALDKFFHDSGFLFTHATLSTYLKGLFPETSKGQTPPPIDRINEPPTVVDATDADSGLEGPTRVMRRVTVEQEMASTLGDNPFGVAHGEEETQIRRNPLLPPDPITEDAQQETVIRKGGRAALRDLELEAQTTQDGDNDLGRILDQVSTADQQTRVMRSVVAPQPSTAMYLLVGGAMMLVGMGIGAVLGGAAAYVVLDDDTVPHDSIPALRVQAPKGATTELDGNPIEGSVPLQPDQGYQLRVNLDGHEPWEQTVTLAKGEHRVIIVMASELKPTK